MQNKKGIMKMKKGVALALVLLLSIGLSMTVYGQEDYERKPMKRVLFISSYSYAWEPVQEQIQGIDEVLQNICEIDYKFMDTKNVTTDRSLQLFQEQMELFMESVAPYDAIILGDDDALLFGLHNKDTLFRGIPMVFEGVNDAYLAEEVSKEPLITGVVEKLSCSDTISVAKKLCPKAVNLVAVVDDSVTGEIIKKEIFSYAEKFPELSFQQVNPAHLSRQQLEEKITSLTKDTILLYAVFIKDGDGNIYSSSQSAYLISNWARIPTFSVVSNGSGTGVLGGEIVSQRKMAAQAADMVKRILSGTPCESLVLAERAPHEYVFDEIAMKKYGIKRSELPKEAVILNHPASFFEKNAQMIRVMVVGVAILLLLLGFSFLDNVHHRRMNSALEKIKEKLEKESKYDSMTQLLNRRMFMEEVEQKINEGEEFGIILLDLDNFKQVNDTLGHNNGDIVLKELANRLSLIQDENFKAFRLAGDEFTGIIDSRNPDVAKAYAYAIQGSFRKPYLLEGENHYFSCSIGIASYPRDGKQVLQLISSADAAMYEVKKRGKGGIGICQDAGKSSPLVEV